MKRTESPIKWVDPVGRKGKA